MIPVLVLLMHGVQQFLATSGLCTNACPPGSLFRSVVAPDIVSSRPCCAHRVEYWCKGYVVRFLSYTPFVSSFSGVNNWWSRSNWSYTCNWWSAPYRFRPGSLLHRSPELRFIVTMEGWNVIAFVTFPEIFPWLSLSKRSELFEEIIM